MTSAFGHLILCQTYHISQLIRDFLYNMLLFLSLTTILWQRSQNGVIMNREHNWIDYWRYQCSLIGKNGENPSLSRNCNSECLTITTAQAGRGERWWREARRPTNNHRLFNSRGWVWNGSVFLRLLFQALFCRKVLFLLSKRRRTSFGKSPFLSWWLS